MHNCKQKECKHKRLEFCELCQKVCCLDCKKEWPEYRDNFYPVITYPPVINPCPIWIGTAQPEAPYLPYITCTGGNS